MLKMCLLKLKTFFGDKVPENQDVCEAMVLLGSQKDEWEWNQAYFDFDCIHPGE